MVVSGSQIVFPPLEHASFHCGHCTAPVFLCGCSGVGHGKDYVLMGCGLSTCMRTEMLHRALTVHQKGGAEHVCPVDDDVMLCTGCHLCLVTQRRWSDWYAGKLTVQRSLVGRPTCP